MLNTRSKLSLLGAVSASLALAISGCSGQSGSTEASEKATQDVTQVTITDNHGEKTIDVPPKRVLATANRTFATLDAWDVELVAGAVSLMPDNISYTKNEDIIDLGLHIEPDLEAAVAAKPDLVITGGRYAEYYDDFQELLPDATIVELTPREDKPLDQELIRQTETLGKIFGKEEAADQLIADFKASMERVKEAYNPDNTVMAVITTGGEINYSAPTVGRTLGPIYDMVGLTPALKTEDASHDHQGDDISVEAIAKANPDWILVMDRDAAIKSADEFTPAKKLLESSAALQHVDAIKNDHVLYMPQNTYLSEGIINYTNFFNTMADAMEAQKSES